ncbi:MAG: helix-turn-helix domain-containing protein [Stenotrophobium sp.]
MRKASKPGRQLRKTIGENIRLERTRLDISQEELAELAGMHRNYIGAVERAEISVGTDHVERLAIALKLKPFQLLQELKRGD